MTTSNASIVHAGGLRYPTSSAGFAPAERFPEYRGEAIASGPNPVYASVRRLFEQLGLDRERLGTAAWNPLGRYIPPGSSVFVLCNFVYHRRPQDSLREFHAKCVHGSVLRALLDYVAIAVGDGVTVRFGNAPLQSCSFEQVLRDAEVDRVVAELTRRGRRVEATDLRLYVTDRSLLGRVRSVERRDESRGVEIDLGAESLLAGLPASGAGPPRFRVADYDPTRIEGFHAGGAHRYVINRALLDADVVISLPKLKTHEKVGITCALKGFVGAVGHKDCLAHHRFGSPRVGGDEYPDSQGWLRAASTLHDWVYRRPADAPLQGLVQIGERTLRRVFRRARLTTGGAWHGNDTCWRMAVDLARILHYADARGVMQRTRQRRHLVLLDGVVAGEGDGPLAPAPVDAGTLLFADDVLLADRLACRLMGWDERQIPLVRDAGQAMRWPLAEPGAGAPSLVVNGRPASEAEVPAVLGRPFLPPHGWVARLRSAA
jgi:uncharacterized protein (DUF362 family)